MYHTNLAWLYTQDDELCQVLKSVVHDATHSTDGTAKNELSEGTA